MGESNEGGGGPIARREDPTAAGGVANHRVVLYTKKNSPQDLIIIHI